MFKKHVKNLGFSFIRNVQAESSNLSSGSILLGFLSAYFPFCFVFVARCGNNGNLSHAKTPRI
jgi:hypothetical protein